LIPLIIGVAMKTRTAVICLHAALVLLAGCSAEQPAPIVGTLERHRFEVAANSSELIERLEVREGDRVRQGQTLAVLDSRVVDAAGTSAAAEVGRAKQRLRELRNGPRAEEIAAAAAQLSAAEADQEQSAREYQRLADIAARGLVAPSQVDAQRRLRDSAAAGVAAARANLQLLQKGTRVEQIAQAQEALTAAEGQLAEQEAQRARLTLLAPVDGTVEALPYRQGERPPAGAAVVILLATGAPYARVYVPEPRRAAITAGQQVQVKVDGRTDALPGVVRFIAGEASFTPYFALTQRDRSRLTYLAEIDLGSAAARDLPVGVPVEVQTGATP